RRVLPARAAGRARVGAGPARGGNGSFARQPLAAASRLGPRMPARLLGALRDGQRALWEDGAGGRLDRRLPRQRRLAPAPRARAVGLARVTSRARKAVVLARGLGTRMRRGDSGARLDPDQEKAAGSGVKAMISFGAGRPFLDYVFSGLADAGLDDICLVIGPEHGEIRGYYGETSPPRR